MKKRMMLSLAVLYLVAFVGLPFPAQAEMDISGTWQLLARSDMILVGSDGEYSLEDVHILPSTSAGSVFSLLPDGTVTIDASYPEYIPAPLHTGGPWTLVATSGGEIPWQPCLDMSAFTPFMIDSFLQEGYLDCGPETDGTQRILYKVYRYDPNLPETVKSNLRLLLQYNTVLDPVDGMPRVQTISVFFERP